MQYALISLGIFPVPNIVEEYCKDQSHIHYRTKKGISALQNNIRRVKQLLSIEYAANIVNSPLVIATNNALTSKISIEISSPESLSPLTKKVLYNECLSLHCLNL